MSVLKASRAGKKIPGRKRGRGIEPLGRRNIVIIHNDFVRARLEVTMLQLRFLLTIAQRDQMKGTFRAHEISVSECINLLGLHTGGSYYTQVREMAANIASAAIWVEQFNGLPEEFSRGDELFLSIPSTERVFRRMQIFDDIVWLKGKEAFVVRFRNEVAPYLLELREQFAQIDVNVMAHISGSYARRFYLYLCSWHPERNPGASWTMTKDELRHWLAVPETYSIKNVRAAVIERAQKDLDGDADLSFDFEPLRNGREVTGWRFTPRKSRRGKLKAIGKKRPDVATAPGLPAEPIAPEDETRANAWWVGADSPAIDEFVNDRPQFDLFRSQRGKAPGPLLLAGLVDWLRGRGWPSPTQPALALG